MVSSFCPAFQHDNDIHTWDLSSPANMSRIEFWNSLNHASTPSRQTQKRNYANSVWGHHAPRILKPLSVSCTMSHYICVLLLLVLLFDKDTDFLATPDIIDVKSQEIRPEDGEVYTKMEDVADELPDSSPRFILLSYPLTLVCLITVTLRENVFVCEWKREYC